MKHIKLATPAVLATLFAVSMVAGCGVKSMPIPPEAARPQQILDLEALPERHGIQLTWTRPQRYASGQSMKDLSGFTVMRAEDQEQYQPIVEVPVTDQERIQIVTRFSYTDNTVESGHDYRYEVVAYTTGGYKSLPSNEAELQYVHTLPPPQGAQGNPTPGTAPPLTPMLENHLPPPAPLPPSH
ncbi:MAG TPA: hypothetical protein VMD75_01965 [Candidatus Binataceae bacterium]|nr:hypothetical protein [Candidatus Binataceae bacterium]